MQCTKSAIPSVYALLLTGALASGCGEVSSIDAGDDQADAEPGDDGSSGNAVLGLDRSSHDFGTITVGSSAAATTFTLSNSGTASSGLVSVDITGTNAGDFAITSDGCNGTTLAASGSCDISVTFAPEATGERSAELSVIADPGGSASASISGTAVEPGALSVSPPSNDFGSVVVSTSSEATVFTVTNTGGDTTGALASALTGAQMNQFAISADNCSGNTLAASATCTLSVSFAPTTVGAKAASLTVSGSPGGTAVSALSGAGMTSAAITISPVSHNFGGALVGTDGASYTFTATNAGSQTTGTLSVTRSGAASSEFSITNDDCNGQTLGGGANCTITVQFAPSSAGDKTASLDVSATPGGSVSAQLLAVGQNPALLTGSPGSAEFGDIEVGHLGTSITWDIENTGDVATGTLSFSNSNGTDFVATNGCSGTLGPGGSCSVTVNFSPSTGGLRNGTLTMSATPGGSVNLTVSGTGMYRLTVTKSGTGTVSSTPGGINCGGVCSELFAGGAAVTLTATTTNGSNYYFSGWSGGGCSGPARDCDVTVNSSMTVSATFSPMTHNLVFVSSISFPSDLGGVAPYDAQCNALASAAGINNNAGNDYVAYMSSTAATAVDRLGNARGWVRLDGLAFTDTLSALTAGSQVYNPIYYTEFGDPLPGAVAFTGTNANGTVRSNQNCDDWTAGSTAGCLCGRAAGGPTGWSSGTGAGCSSNRYVFCMGKSRTAQLVPTPVSGKRIWMTNTSYTPGSMTPDEKCTAEKPAGVGTARALLAYTTTAADAQLDSGANYVRVDGQLVGSGADIIALAIQSGIWQSANGTYLGTRTYTGQTSLTSVGSATTTCDNWTATTSNARIGWSAVNSTWFWSFSSEGCSGSGAEESYLYCVEQ